ncbi:MAG TPA: S9 family peptidase [Chloroflexota bacterium]
MTDLATRLEFDYARFVNVRRAYGPAFLGGGDRIGFLSDLLGVPQVFSVYPIGGWPEQLTFTQERIGALHPSPTGDEMIVATDVGGDERIQLHLVSAHGETMRPLTEDLEAMHLFGGWSPDGQSFAFAANRRDRSRFDVYVQALSGGPARLLYESTGQCEVAAWSPDRRALLVSLVESSADNTLVEVALADGAARELTPHQGAARFERPLYGPRGAAIYLLTDRDADCLVVARLDRASLGLETILDLGWDVEDIALSPDSGRLAYHVNVDGYSELYLRDLKSRQARPIRLPAGVVSRGFVGNWNDHLAWSPSGRQLAFSFTTARETQNVWVADADSGRASRLTHATQAGIPSDELVDAKLVRYPTFDRREIPAFLYAPRGARPNGSRPAIVLIHGGPASQIRPAFDPTIQYFVHRGYAVLTPNVRGSTGYGKAYMALDDVERRMDSVADATAAAEWLVAAGWARADAIAAMGQSYGGFMVLACLCTEPSTWAAGVDIYGIASFVSFMENTHPMRRRHRAVEYGSLERDRELLERISPLNQVDRIRAPLLAVHGERDMRVPITETEQIVAALTARGVPVELIRLPDEGHGLVRLANRLRVYPAIADFLDRHLRSAPGAR